MKVGEVERRENNVPLLLAGLEAGEGQANKTYSFDRTSRCLERVDALSTIKANGRGGVEKSVVRWVTTKRVARRLLVASQTV